MEEKIRGMLCEVTTYWLESDLAAFGVAFLIAGILLPRIILIAFRKKLFDKHDARKVHHGIVPRLGGIAFLPAVILAVAAVLGFNIRFGEDNVQMAMNGCVVPVFFELCAVMLMFLVGIADDLVGVRYRAKFGVQIVSAVFIILSGIWISDLCGLLWIWSLPPWLGYMLTVLLVVYVVNAVNLIDGIDGLAAGLCTLALIFYGVILFMEQQYIYSMIAFATLGTLVPFIYYNLFGSVQKQKKIFMGDTGSLTTGMVLAFLSLVMLRTTPQSDGFWRVNPVVLAFTPLIVPCFDVARVTLHRLRFHRNPFLPDRSHIHHKLLAVGMSSKGALATILSVSALFMIVNVWLSRYLDLNILLGADILVWTFANIGLTRQIKAREKKLGRKLYE